MKKVVFTIAIALIAPLLANKNFISAQCKESIFQISKSELAEKINLNTPIIVKNKLGEVLPSQLTYNGNLVVLVPQKCGKIYIGNGESFVDTTTCGAHYPERLDDIAWENNLMAYRAYGPALQRSGERAYGYDIWTKSTSKPVVKERYYNHLFKGISYHEDHGNGMDVYAVGPTLGGGTAAPFIDSTILFPYCWKSYEILDNGPIRFTVRLEYPPFTIGNDTITEIRTIILDHGSYLNHTTIEYKGATKAIPIVAGIVIHSTDPNSYYSDKKQRYITVQDPTQSSGNGVIFVGITAPKEFQQTLLHQEHILALDTIAPYEKFEYLWGASWSNCGMDSDTWNSYMKEQFKSLQKSPKIKIEFITKQQ